MSRSQNDILNITNGIGQEEYQFFLKHGSKLIQLSTMPDGWSGDDGGESSYYYNENYKSVLRSLSSNELTFFKEARDFIEEIYEMEGPEAQIYFYVKKLDRSDYAYKDYPAASKLDLSDYHIDEIGVTTMVVDNSFAEKVKNRETQEVDLFKTTSVEGLEVDAFVLPPMKMPDTTIGETSSFEDSTAIPPSLFHVVPIAVVSSDFAETQTPVNDVNKKTGAFFRETTRSRLLHITGNPIGDILAKSGTIDASIEFTLVIIDENENIVSTDIIYNDSVSASNEGLIFNFPIDELITLDKDHSLLFQCVYSVSGNGDLLYGSVFLYADEIYQGSPERNIVAFPYYEALLRNLQIITDSNNPLQSTFFGRTDTPFTQYDEDGTIGHLTKGIYFRDPQYYNQTLPVKFKDFFKSLSTIFNLGMGIEKVDGVYKVVIEHADYFRNEYVVLDLSDRINPRTLKKENIPDLYFQSLEWGYSKANTDYEENAGILEFNTKSSWTTVIKSVFNSSENICRDRADGQGMMKILNAPSKEGYDPTEDVSGDGDNFLIASIRDGAGFKAKTNEGYEFIGGAVYAFSSFNIDYAPSLCLRRHGGDIRAFLHKHLNSYIRYQSSEKNNSLITRVPGGSDIHEDGDIMANDLDVNRFIPEAYPLESYISIDELNRFDVNPNGLIKVSDDIYGWIYDTLKTKNKNGKMECKILRANLNVINPIELE